MQECHRPKPSKPSKPRKLPATPQEPVLDPIVAADVLPQQGKGEISSDTQGSYTGTPEDDVHPVQDADDL